jgi:hypothetical protein
MKTRRNVLKAEAVALTVPSIFGGAMLFSSAAQQSARDSM